MNKYKLKRVCTISINKGTYVLSHAQLFATLWTVAHQSPLSLGFPRQEYWSGLPFPPPRGLSNPRIKNLGLESPTQAGGSFITEPRGKL